MKTSIIFQITSFLVLAGVLLAACAPQPGANQVLVTGDSSTNTPAAAASTPTTVNPASATPASSSTSSGSSGSGTKYVLVATGNEVSYAVREQLARLNFPSDAVGKTSNITGSIVINPDGTLDANNSKFTVDVSSLQTDEAMRDNYVRRNILQTDQFPNAVFVPTQVSGLPAAIPQSGDVNFKVTGNLTIRDVTKPVTWDVTGSIANGQAVGTATTNFTFEDFNLPLPHVSIVLSVVDKITLTVKVTLQVAGN
jgi:polyisoprenoid-binding protein YceI